jgi:hypothetical protein
MAIKNTLLAGTAADWTDGQVLYAEDLNDTFDASVQLTRGTTGLDPVIVTVDSAVEINRHHIVDGIISTDQKTITLSSGASVGSFVVADARGAGTYRILLDAPNFDEVIQDGTSFSSVGTGSVQSTTQGANIKLTNIGSPSNALLLRQTGVQSFTGTGDLDLRASSDGSYLVVAHSTSPYISVFSRSGTTFTQLSNPSTLPTGAGQGAAINNDGTFVAVAHGTTPFISMYSRSGSTLTKITNPTTLPTGTGFSVACGDSGSFFYVTVGHSASPYITIYRNNSGTYQKLADPSTLPPTNGSPTDIAYSPDASHFVIAMAVSPYLSIYRRDSDTTFLRVANPATLPSSSCDSCAWSANGQYVAIGGGTSTPNLRIYNRDSDTSFVSMTINGSGLPSSTGYSMQFSPDSTELYIRSNTWIRFKLISGQWYQLPLFGASVDRSMIPITSTLFAGTSDGANIHLFDTTTPLKVWKVQDKNGTHTLS